MKTMTDIEHDLLTELAEREGRKTPSRQWGGEGGVRSLPPAGVQPRDQGCPVLRTASAAISERENSL
jgi:hypothetical protein